MNGRPKRIRVSDLVPMKERGERIVMLTAYDATMTLLLDRAGNLVLRLIGRREEFAGPNTLGEAVAKGALAAETGR